MLYSQKWWFLVAKTVAPVRGIEKGKVLSLHSRERGNFFRAHYAQLSKVAVFGCKNSGTSKGYGERKISLTMLERRGHFLRAHFDRLKSGGFWLQKQWHQ